MGMAAVKCKRRRPAQLRGIPGNIGRKLPSIPKIINTPARMTKIRSISKVFLKIGKSKKLPVINPMTV